MTITMETHNEIIQAIHENPGKEEFQAGLGITVVVKDRIPEGKEHKCILGSMNVAGKTYDIYFG